MSSFKGTIASGLFILILCLIPSSQISKIDIFKVNYLDIVVHFIMFFGFYFLVFLDLKRYYPRGTKRKKLLVHSLTISIALGISSEALQYLLSFLHRTPSAVDLIFDIIGSLAAILFIKFIMRSSVPA
jgi:VanZ family protein